jgi:hypothetical protein
MSKRTLNNLAVSLLFLILLSLAFYDVVFGGKTFKVTTANSQALPTGAYGQADNKPPFIPVNGTDTPVMEEPVYEFIKNNLRRGILPFWNPHQALGYPLIGMLEIGLFFPLTFIMYLLPNIIAWDVLILSRLFCAGLFTFWFMRTLRFSNLSSLCAGLIFMLSGPMVLLQYWTVNVDLLVPLILIAMDRLIRAPDNKKMTVLALVVALSIFAGHPEHIFLCNAYAMAFFIYRTWSLKKFGDWKKSTVLCLTAYGLGFALGAIVLFPFLQNFLFEAWHNHPPGTGLMMEEQRDRALTLALPHFFQSVNLTYQWSFAGWWGGYLGTIPLALAALSLFNNHRRGLNYFFAALAFIIVGKEYGLPVINWLGHLPLFNACRYAIHTPHLVAFTIAVLAGMGLRTVLLNRCLFAKGLYYSITLIVIISAHFFFLKGKLDQSLALRASLLAGVLLIIFQMLLLLKDRKSLRGTTVTVLLTALVFAELFLYIHRERPRRFDSFPQVPYIEFLKSSPERIRSYGMFWAFYPNTGTGFETDDLGYFFSLAPRRFVNFVNTLLIKDHFRNDFRPPALRAIPIEGKRHLLDLLNVKYVVGPDPARLARMLLNFNRKNESDRAVYASEVTIFEREGYFPRAFIAHKAAIIIDEEKSLQAINQLGPQLRHIAILHTAVDPAIARQLQGVPVLSQSTAEITKYTANEVSVKARMEHPGFVILGDAYHPDWTARVDGRPATIFQTDYLLRSVFVPSGEHLIEFKFVPKWFYAGGLVSLAALVLLILAFRWKRTKK